MSNLPFLNTIRDHPHDFGPRLIYSDWLEEQGFVRRAELIRDSITAASPCLFELDRIVEWETERKMSPDGLGCFHVQFLGEALPGYRLIRDFDCVAVAGSVFEAIKVQYRPLINDPDKVSRVAGTRWEGPYPTMRAVERKVVEERMSKNLADTGKFFRQFLLAQTWHLGLMTECVVTPDQWLKHGEGLYGEFPLEKTTMIGELGVPVLGGYDKFYLAGFPGMEFCQYPTHDAYIRDRNKSKTPR